VLADADRMENSPKRIAVESTNVCCAN